MGEAALKLDDFDFKPLEATLFQGIAKGLTAPEMSYREFIPEAWPITEPSTALLPNWHFDCIAEHFEAVVRGQITDLVVNIPPRNAKSLLGSVLLPTWAWTQWPWLKWLFVSYAANLSTKHSLDRRRIIESPWYESRWGGVVRLQPDQNKKNEYENTARGIMFSTSIGGSATGFGADIQVYDDPMNPKIAESKAEREQAVEDFTLTFASRGNNKNARRILIEQRLHKDDVTGTVLRQGGWTHLSLPAIAEKKTIIEFPISKRRVTRDAGEVLHPDRQGPDELAKLKTRLGSRGFGAQYQQNPAVEEAAYFKRDNWKRYELAPAEMAKNMGEIWESWDLSFKGAKTSDYAVGLVIGARGPDFFILDIVRDQMSFSASCLAIESLSAKWPSAAAKLVEDKANGPAAIDELNKKVSGLIPIEPEGDKVARAAAISPYQEAGNVYLPDPKFCPKVNDFIEELADFPGGGNDDQVDAFSQGLRWFIKRRDRTAGVTVF
jgi:predicted phage terminase large subunit-like protein